MSEPFEIDPDDLDGSTLGEVLKDYADRGVYVAPLIGVNFVEPWAVFGAAS
jgi:hypothetical protein